jgi:hypothetical protein
MRAEEIMKKRRDRAIAIILSVKEREVDPVLARAGNGTAASKALRKVVLDQVNDLCDIAIDILTSSDVATFEFNPDIWGPKIQGKLDEIHQAVLAGNGKHSS